MMDFIIYLLKVIAIQGVLFILYYTCFRHSARHAFNRFYLLAALTMAFVIPLIEISLPFESTQVVNDIPAILWLSDPAPSLQQFEMIPTSAPKSSLPMLILWFCYGMISFFLLVRSIGYILALQKLKKHSEYIKRKWFSLFKTTHEKPFSFFKNIFIPARLFGSDGFDQVLAHECVHVKQRHSVDRVLLDFLVSLFWFNPFIYLYRNALIEIHEYQADEAVINQFQDPIAYQEVLFSQLRSAEYAGLVSHFNFSMIKKRIVMMNKKKKMTGWIYSLSLPVFLAMAFTFSNREAMKPIQKVGEELTSLIGPLYDFNEWVEVPFQDMVPSVQPVSSSELTRLTSGFGMRTHPITKEKKQHNGADFSCAIGTDVLATADGTVSGIWDSETGYGKMITIQHGEHFKTRYAQLSAFKVKEGDNVQKGDVIALSGNSGMSTAPHLHYEVMKDGVHVNPMDYIKDFKAVPVIKGVELEKSSQKNLQKEKEMLASERAEQVKFEKLRAKELQLNASEKEREAYSKQLEAEEKRLVEKQKQLKAQEAMQDTRGTEIRIRSEEKDPMYVLNGKVVEDVSGLNPNAIKDVTVLKGKEATSKYGKKGKKGVIEINTREVKEPKENQNNQRGQNDNDNKNRQSYRVIIDPGHGGADPGATSPSGLQESEIALEVSKRIESYLEDDEIELIFTRSSDDFVSLKERSALSQDADLFLSIHTDNYEDQDESFILPIYFEGNEYSRNSLYFATLLSEEFQKSGQFTKVGSIYECAPQPTTKYDLLGKAKCPAVLLNVGFFSNLSVEKSLSSEEGQNTVAMHIAKAIQASRI